MSPRLASRIGFMAQLKLALAAIAAIVPLLSFGQSAELKAEYDKLVAEHSAAYQAWLAPYMEAVKAGSKNPPALDMSKDPTAAFAPRFRAFAEKAGKDDIALVAWMWVLGSGDESVDIGFLLDTFMSSAGIDSLVKWLEWSTYSIGYSGAVSALTRIERESPHRDVKASALASKCWLLAVSPGATEDTQKASLPLLKRLGREYAGTEAAKRGDSLLFAVENLGIGKVAPDFEVTDGAGKTFKLSDYRGKVVVLDFWGFW